MSRPVRVRDNYTAERTRLTRLEDAVLKDHRLVEDDRVRVVRKIRELTTSLQEVDGKLEGKQKRRD